jgi:DNA-binding protein HU-beta
MNKSEFTSLVAEKAQTSKAAAERVVDAIFSTTSGAIAEVVRAGGDLSIPGFGKFKPKKRAARQGRNPRTGAAIDIPERTTIAFSPGKGLRDVLDAGSSPPRKAKKKAKTPRATGASKE